MMACFNSSTLLSGLGHEAGLVCREPGGPRLTCLIPAHYQQLRGGAIWLFAHDCPPGKPKGASDSRTPLCRREWVARTIGQRGQTGDLDAIARRISLIATTRLACRRAAQACAATHLQAPLHAAAGATCIRSRLGRAIQSMLASSLFAPISLVSADSSNLCRASRRVSISEQPFAYCEPKRTRSFPIGTVP
jgi:hypothetical protein